LEGVWGEESFAVELEYIPAGGKVGKELDKARNAAFPGVYGEKGFKLRFVIS
jgi:hypothetical protein